MGEGEVLLRHLALVGDEVLGAGLVAARGAPPDRRLPGESRERDVEVVGGSAQHPDPIAGEPLEPAVAAPEIPGASRDEVADACRQRGTAGEPAAAAVPAVPAAPLGGDDALVRVAVLPVVEPRQPTERTRKGGVPGDVPYPLAAEPHLAVVPAKALDVLGPGPRAHIQSGVAGAGRRHGGGPGQSSPATTAASADPAGAEFQLPSLTLPPAKSSVRRSAGRAAGSP